MFLRITVPLLKPLHLLSVSLAFIVAICATSASFAQVQNHYVPANVTGQLALTGTVNLSKISTASAGWTMAVAEPAGEIFRRQLSIRRLRHPGTPPVNPRARGRSGASESVEPVPQWTPSLSVGGTAQFFGFEGISHADQRYAAGGNQFSIEPPSPSIAVANGFVLEGVNDAIRIFSVTGTPLVGTIASNQLFGLAPAIDRSTGINGPYLTDMRVYYDQGIGRWFVLQRSQDNDSAGNTLNKSHIYLAVSQSSDPTASWNIYVMDTTNAANRGCPCLSDYTEIGSDQFGVYITANEYDTVYYGIVDSTILAISKSALGVGATAPKTYRFLLPMSLGYEFSIQPASAPPLADNVLISGGVEYFVSSQATYSSDNTLAVWALSNTASLQGNTPSLLLTETTIVLSQGGNTLNYVYPNVATQPTGTLPYGSTVQFQPQPPLLDGGPDSRVQSVSYAGGRLYVALPTQLRDDAGNSVVGGIYAILSPTFRNNILSAAVLKQGYLYVKNNHILRPAISVDSSGRGVIAFTLVGPSYYPSAAFTTFTTTIPNTGIIDPAAPSSVVVAAAGVAPEDGFTGYYPQPSAPVARWGDYCTAVTSTDGSLWMVAEYIPGERSPLANWGTFVYQYVPVLLAGSVTGIPLDEHKSLRSSGYAIKLLESHRGQ